MEYLGGGSALDLVSWGPSELGDPGGWGAQGAGQPGGQGQTEEVVWGLSLNPGFLWPPLLPCLGDWLFLRTQLVLRGPGPLLACGEEVRPPAGGSGVWPVPVVSC